LPRAYSDKKVADKIPTGVATKTAAPVIRKLPTMAFRNPPCKDSGAGVSIVKKFKLDDQLSVWGDIHERR
jgi:hypothetical protein